MLTTKERQNLLAVWRDYRDRLVIYRQGGPCYDELQLEKARNGCIVVERVLSAMGYAVGGGPDADSSDFICRVGQVKFHRERGCWFYGNV